MDLMAQLPLEIPVSDEKGQTSSLEQSVRVSSTEHDADCPGVSQGIRAQTYVLFTHFDLPLLPQGKASAKYSCVVQP